MSANKHDARRLLEAYREARTPDSEAKARVWTEVEAALAAPATHGEAAGDPAVEGAGTQTGHEAAGRTTPSGGGGTLGTGSKLLLIGGALISAAGLWWWSSGAAPRPPADTTPQRQAPPVSAASSGAARQPATSGGAAHRPEPEAMAHEALAEKPGAAQVAAPEPELDDPTAAVPRPATTRQPRGTARSSSLAREMKLLTAAQRAAEAGDPARALRVLERHARRFADGVLAEEREAGRVAALCRLGRTAEARRLLQRFDARFPGSPLSVRAARACEEAAQGGSTR